MRTQLSATGVALGANPRLSLRVVRPACAFADEAHMSGGKQSQRLIGREWQYLRRPDLFFLHLFGLVMFLVQLTVGLGGPLAQLRIGRPRVGADVDQGFGLSRREGCAVRFTREAPRGRRPPWVPVLKVRRMNVSSQTRGLLSAAATLCVFSRFPIRDCFAVRPFRTRSATSRTECRLPCGTAPRMPRG